MPGAGAIIGHTVGPQRFKPRRIGYEHRLGMNRSVDSEHGRGRGLERAPYQAPSVRSGAVHRPRRVWPVAAGFVVAALAAIAGAVSLRPDRAPSEAAPGTAPPTATVPRLSVPSAVAPSVPGFVSTLRGLVDGAATLTANGEQVTIEPGGAFTWLIAQGTPQIDLAATSTSGSTTATTVAVTDVPVAPTYPATAGLHVRGEDWAQPAIRQRVLDLARAGRINAVELDIKDEAGVIGYTSSVPLAATIGASAGHYGAAESLAALHATGVRVIGRLVCFLDPLLANWAWSNARPDLLVLDGAGTAPLANDYGDAAFSNPASPEVRQYQIDLAAEAVGLGFDEILYDYVRRPEGDLAAMQLPGLQSAPDVAIARFVGDTRTALAASPAALGVSVFGISATRPEPTGQDIRLLAPLVDYLSPMVYPSHWSAGEYGVADPLRQPADIVSRSVADFERIAAGSDTAVVPWLEDFSARGVSYGPAEVRAQIDAARSVGAEGFLLWNPGSTYSVDALDG